MIFQCALFGSRSFCRNAKLWKKPSNWLSWSVTNPTRMIVTVVFCGRHPAPDMENIPLLKQALKHPKWSVSYSPSRRWKRTPHSWSRRWKRKGRKLWRPLLAFGSRRNAGSGNERRILHDLGLHVCMHTYADMNKQAAKHMRYECVRVYDTIRSHTHTHTHSVHRNFHMKQLITYFCDNISVVRHKWFHRHEIINNQGPFLKSVLEAYFIWVNRKKVVDAWCFCNGDRYVQETWKLIWAPKADIFDYTAAFCSFF